MLRNNQRLSISNSALIGFGIASFYLVIARNGDLSGKVTLSLVLYGGCLAIALLGSRLKCKYIEPKKLLWLISLVPFLYSSPLWLDAALFALGIGFIVLLEYRTSDLRGLYKAIIFVAIVNALCVFIQFIDKGFFDEFARAWYPEGMYQQYLRTMRYENYLNGCNAVSGNTAGYLAYCIGLLFSIHFIRRYKKINTMNIVIFIVSFLALLLVGKRSILLCAVAAIVIIYILSGRASKKIQKFFFLVLITLVLMRILPLTAELFPEINTITRIADSINGLLYGQDITSGRSTLLGYALLQFESAPILGIGWKGFNRLTTSLYNYSAAHYVNNDYVQVLCETGIVGFICIYLPMIICLIKTIRLYTAVAKSELNDIGKTSFVFSLFIQLFYIMYSFFEIPLYDRCFFFMYIIAVSIGYCVQKEFRVLQHQT
ncbi:MAG: O-antigen ligase family protein [Eubacteriales bacterium]|nr:O-antigen ligase family protein [Eubacteriales bacterium]